jgi:hypothetical protein
MLRKLLDIPILPLPDCSPEAGVYSEGSWDRPSRDRLFLVFAPPSSKCWDDSKVASRYCMLLGWPLRVEFVKIKPVAQRRSLLASSSFPRRVFNTQRVQYQNQLLMFRCVLEFRNFLQDFIQLRLPVDVFAASDNFAVIR